MVSALALLGVLIPVAGAPPSRGAAVNAGSPTPTVPPVAAMPSPRPTRSIPEAPALRLSGPVPSAGSGTFEYATGRGSVVGVAGSLRRYRVAVENGTNEAVGEFAEVVDSVLGDARSWIGSGRLRLQRVPNGGGHDFTVYLVTAGTARKMCSAVWVDIRVDRKPYTSCRGRGKVIINLDRWRLSVSHYVEAEVPLTLYRAYVINHEVGHELGHGHERCPGAGKRAPVMMQQTLLLDGCVANPWPYVRGKRYAGPPL
ncbi:Protein of unknown function [Micromonospora echinaurantiaca]|uniref:DUF3152 domain-containing protein n=2 Tax=Micromonospora echinaurantiaca TaxID=47857 RepID=A0A1C5IH87_9ACTN|nr:Protein of unknown function [Micromonospora echinaurantiaca]